MEHNMDYPIYIKGTKCGTLTVTQEKLHLVFYAECDYTAEIVRLSVFGNGKSAYLGVMEPNGDKLRLTRRKSREELKNFPRPIEYAADNEQKTVQNTADTIWRKAANGTLISDNLIAIPSDMSDKYGILREINGRQYIVFPGKRKRWKKDAECAKIYKR